MEATQKKIVNFLRTCVTILLNLGDKLTYYLYQINNSLAMNTELEKFIKNVEKSLKKDGEITISVRVIPKSQRAGIVDVFDEDVLKIKVNSAPEKGKANKEVKELLSKEFGVRKSDIEIVAGDTTQNKLIKIYL